jgi:hypothetical protein
MRHFEVAKDQPVGFDMTKILRRRAPRKPFSEPEKPIFTGFEMGAGDFAGNAKNFALLAGRFP